MKTEITDNEYRVEKISTCLSSTEKNKWEMKCRHGVYWTNRENA